MTVPAPLTIRHATTSDISAMVDVFIDSWEMVRTKAFSEDELKIARKEEQDLLEIWLADLRKTALIADIGNTPMGFIIYGQASAGVADSLTVIKQFNTIPTLDYKIGSVLFKSLCTDETQPGTITVTSTYQGEDGYRAFGLTGNRNLMQLSENRRCCWRECSEGVFPRFTDIKREAYFDRLLTL